ncbi:MAG: mammalian cell entry protein, partial [Nocardia sp.]|nr:mammalian cell entry protein [Nocardia sp.]
QNKDQLGGSLHRFVTITAQMRANARNLTESTDLIPLTFQNVSNSIDPHLRVLQVHALTDKSVLDNEALSTLCERLAMRADGCRTGKMADFGPDFGLTAALLGITKK